MQSLKSKLAVGVLSMAIVGVGASPSWALLGDVIGGVGDVVGGVGDTVGDVVGGVGDTVGGIVDDLDDTLGGTLGAAASLLAGVGIDLAPLDISAWTEDDAQVLVNLQALGLDVEALLALDLNAGLGIFAEDGLHIDALVCALLESQVNADLFGYDVIDADLLAQIGLALGVDLTDQGLGVELGLDCGCEGDYMDEPVNPADPQNPNDLDPAVNPVPEPASAALGLMGLGAIVAATRRRRGRE